jgi:hypothetical protein
MWTQAMSAFQAAVEKPEKPLKSKGDTHAPDNRRSRRS